MAKRRSPGSDVTRGHESRRSLNATYPLVKHKTASPWGVVPPWVPAFAGTTTMGQRKGPLVSSLSKMHEQDEIPVHTPMLSPDPSRPSASEYAIQQYASHSMSHTS